MLDERSVFTTYINYCSVVRGIVKCTNCQSIQSITESPLCSKCKSVLDEKQAMYKLVLSFSVFNDSILSTDFAFAIGRVLDQVIGFPVNVFISLCEENEKIIDLLRKYFVGSQFRMSIVGSRVTSIALPPGNKLTFLKFLSMQPNYEDIEKEVSKRINKLEEFDEEAIKRKEESKQRGKEILDLMEIEELDIPDKIDLVKV